MKKGLKITSDFPKTIYKFRDWELKYNKTILTKSELFFAKASDFNDPFDCVVPSYSESHLSKSHLQSLIKENFRRQNPSITESELDEKIKLLPEDLWNINESKIANLKEGLNQMQDFFHNKYGIVSLSEDPYNILMWGHYSNSHKGFCVGFDTEALAQHLIQKVNSGVALRPIDYVEKLPVQDKNDKEENLAKKMFFTKNVDWKYEKEWRLLVNGLAKKVVEIPAKVFKEIILGFKMEEEYKNEIISFCKKKFPHVKIYQSEMSDKEYKMKIRLIQ